MKITGVFKDYNNLRLAYGIGPADKVDEKFDAFLHKISSKNCILGNYTPTSKTFDTTLLVEDPARPGSGIIVHQYLDGHSRGFGDNMGINKLDLITQVDTDKYIYCTSCGFIVSKDTRYDSEPRFNYGDIYANTIAVHPANPTTITGVTIPLLTADVNHRMYCPKERTPKIFAEVGTSFLP